MKAQYKLLYSLFVCGLGQTVLTGCNEEKLFSNSGESKVRFDVNINSKIVTKAIEDDEMARLKESCVIYISDDKGLLHKWKGIDNIPEEGVFLKHGEYLAEAWAGDSVSASLDQRFFKGEKTFTVDPSIPSTQVAITCKLANVIASVDNSTIDPDLIQEISVKFSNTGGSYTLTEDIIAEKVYFMMPDDDHNLNFQVEIKDKEGNSFTKSGVIENVESAHEYRLVFTTGSVDSVGGLGSIEIMIEEFVEEIDGEITIYGAPVFAWADPTIKKQIVFGKTGFESTTLIVASYGGFSSILITPNDEKTKSALNNLENIELIGLSPSALVNLKDMGIEVEFKENIDNENIYKTLITFNKSWLDNLKKEEKAYSITVTASDNRYEHSGKTSSFTFGIATTEEAIAMDDLIVIDPDFTENDLLAVLATSAKIPYQFDADSDIANPQIQYRIKGESQWDSYFIVKTRASMSGIAELTNLTPGSEYEYRCVGGEVNESGEYEFESEVFTFKTESIFTIPNASMEDWHLDGKVMEPSLASEKHSFWDTGNHGSQTMNVTLTQNSTEIVGNGLYSAKLRSQFVGVGTLGKHAAGNLFAGTYKGTQGTDGIIEFGRPFNGSHPKALKLMANYRPEKVEKNVSGQNYLNVGDIDQGQIYIALTSEPVTVTTADKSTLFNSNSRSVLAYGEVTWDKAFGPDGKLQEVVIDFDYKESAKTSEAKYIVIVCSASKYGDYFVGGEGSTMYVDDFELIYE